MFLMPKNKKMGKRWVLTFDWFQKIRKIDVNDFIFYKKNWIALNFACFNVLDKLNYQTFSKKSLK